MGLSRRKREGYVAKKPPSLSNKQNIVPIYPFKDDGMDIGDIKALLIDNGMGLPIMNGDQDLVVTFAFTSKLENGSGSKSTTPNFLKKRNNTKNYLTDLHGARGEP